MENHHDELLEFSEFDTEHLLWEEIKGLVYLARDLETSLMSEAQSMEILNDLDSLKLKLKKFGTIKEVPILRF